jgi:hypothetical protein
MEVAGLEPATSWVRFRRNPLRSLPGLLLFPLAMPFFPGGFAERYEDEFVDVQSSGGTLVLLNRGIA